MLLVNSSHQPGVLIDFLSGFYLSPISFIVSGLTAPVLRLNLNCLVNPLSNFLFFDSLFPKPSIKQYTVLNDKELLTDLDKIYPSSCKNSALLSIKSVYLKSKIDISNSYHSEIIRRNETMRLDPLCTLEDCTRMENSVISSLYQNLEHLKSSAVAAVVALEADDGSRRSSVGSAGSSNGLSLKLDQ